MNDQCSPRDELPGVSINTYVEAGLCGAIVSLALMCMVNGRAVSSEQRSIRLSTLTIVLALCALSIYRRFCCHPKVRRNKQEMN